MATVTMHQEIQKPPPKLFTITLTASEAAELTAYLGIANYDGPALSLYSKLRSAGVPPQPRRSDELRDERRDNVSGVMHVRV